MNAMEQTSETNLVFRRATGEDREAVREAMAKFFYAEETVTVCYYNGSEVTRDDMEFSLSLIEHGYVTLALDGDRIVGLTGAGTIAADEAAKLREQAEAAETEKFGDILRFLAHMAEHGNVCKRFGVEQAFHVYFIAVDPDLRGKSLAKQLMEMQFELAAQLGVAVMSGDITNIHAGRMALGMGLECVYTVLFNDYRDEKSGRQVFVTQEPHEARTFVAKLEQ
ncbi:uncharacterized protein LOC6049585 [Culex quinquefasciatus]|nr:uncharacterized protein LOC6049585 [Culex quinquefasciatus]